MTAAAVSAAPTVISAAPGGCLRGFKGKRGEIDGQRLQTGGNAER
jgi:hypothetical protein